MCGLDPWPEIIGRLTSHWHEATSTVRQASGRRKRRSRAVAARAVYGVATIRRIEWQPDTTVLLSWSDATRDSSLVTDITPGTPLAISATFSIGDTSDRGVLSR
ncbi:hypothetical protein B0G73_101548 [Paraburkholderia sp. BL25I1N1]|nr:hypothetical protein B0G73_101548 [Paraburkholderia sp. BL25I1N1]